MKKFTLIFCFLASTHHVSGQCLNATNLHTTNISYINAQANWSAAPDPHHYIIHYRELGSSSWNNLSNIDSTMTTRNIPQLQPLTTYEWQIKTFCDSTNQPNSGWSVSDTFTTTAFTPAAFSPYIYPLIGNVQCNEPTTFSIVASQVLNEPDIDSTIFWSNKGYFNIGALNAGDTVGDATYASNFLNFTSVLTVWFTLGQNYATINSIDSLGSVMGFFSIENLSSGVKIRSSSPIDGNNYTSGYTSRLNFTDLFVNPNQPGPITFTANITSELGDVINTLDSSIIISCPPTGINNAYERSRVIKNIDFSGKLIFPEKNKPFIEIYNDGTVEKKMIIE